MYREDGKRELKEKKFKIEKKNRRKNGENRRLMIKKNLKENIKENKECRKLSHLFSCT